MLYEVITFGDDAPDFEDEPIPAISLEDVPAPEETLV